MPVSLRQWLFNRSNRLACRVICDGDHPYLERYFLFRRLGITAYLHRFVASDPDRGLHDHPWPWAVSLVLAGQYRELRRSGARDVRWLNFLTGDSFHRVTLGPHDRSVWTLFIHRDRRVKPWGFWHESTGHTPAAVQQSRATWTEHLNTASGQWWLTSPRGADTAGRMPADG